MDFLSRDNIYGPPDVFTNNPMDHIRKLFFGSEEISIRELERRFSLLEPGNQRKLIVVTERVEFVYHLLRLRDLLVEHRVDSEPDRMYTQGESLVYEIPDNIEFHGMEFNGVDHDIDALCFYLLLTCIECIEGSSEYVDMATWLENNWDTLCIPGESPKAFIRRIKEQYYDEYGVSRAFARAFLEHLPTNLRTRLITHFAVVRLDERRIEAGSWSIWAQLTDDQKVQATSRFLYKEVRNKFTHQSHRSFFPNTPVRNLLATSNNVLVALVRPEEDNLLSLLQELLCVLVKNYLP